MRDRGKKVCILAPVHLYSDVRVYQKEARTLAGQGYRITILARKDQEPTEASIKVIGVPRYKTRLYRFCMQPWMLWKALETKADIYHLHNPDTLPIGFILKLLGKRVIYDTHEDFSRRILMREWIPGCLRKPAARWVGRWERLAGRVLQGVIATQEGVTQRIGGKCILIGNAPITKGAIIDQAFRLSCQIAKGTPFRAIYAGYISKNRGLYSMVQALEEANRNRDSEMRLWLMGPCPNPTELAHAQAMPGWEFVDYLGELPQEMAFAHMIRSDVGMITILDVGDHAQTSPNKIFEYQRFGIPFVASDFTAWRSQLEPVASGLFVDPENPQEIAQALSYLIDHPDRAKEMGERGSAYTLNVYNWEKESEKLLQLYEKIG